MLGWLTGRTGRRERAALTEWRNAWAAALDAADGRRVSELRQWLDALGAQADDVEIELEMVDGLSELVPLAARLRNGDVPIIQTGHRVAGSDACHFSAPASLPDDPLQPGGRVILTEGRAIFAGGGRASQLAWHRIAQVVRTERDLLFIANDRQTAQRFRFNSFGDALCAAALSRHLAGRHRDRTGAL